MPDRGINRKTGNRWRYGRSIRNSVGERVHYPPVQIEEGRPRSSRYLAEEERVTIADLLSVGDGVRAIARKLGRAASTISREVRRNRDKDGRYRPHDAEQAARARALKPRKRRLAIDAVLGEAVCGLLGKRWSPEQVVHELRELFGERARWLCAESIYQAIYDPGCEVTRPARRRRRRRRLRGLARRGRLTAMRMIDERPLEVAGRVQAGHWEGDLIMGAGNRTAIGTLVKRTTRFVILLVFPDAVGSAEAVREAIGRALETPCVNPCGEIYVRVGCDSDVGLAVKRFALCLRAAFGDGGVRRRCGAAMSGIRGSPTVVRRWRSGWRAGVAARCAGRGRRCRGLATGARSRRTSARLTATGGLPPTTIAPHRGRQPARKPRPDRYPPVQAPPFRRETRRHSPNSHRTALHRGPSGQSGALLQAEEFSRYCKIEEDAGCARDRVLDRRQAQHQGQTTDRADPRHRRGHRRRLPRHRRGARSRRSRSATGG